MIAPTGGAVTGWKVFGWSERKRMENLLLGKNLTDAASI